MDIDFEKLADWIRYSPDQPMLFQTVPFYITFSVFYLFYSLIYRTLPLRNFLILLFSLFFYYKISGLFVFVLVGMAFSDFLIGKGIHAATSDRARNRWMYLSLFINLGTLAYFKYTYFFIDLMNGVGNTGISISFRILQPIGISYFIFKSLSYIIDLNRELIEKPEKNFINYLVYIAYFPNILAGPITKAREFIPQLEKHRPVGKREIALAVYLLSMGLIKKIAVADFISANLVDRVFESPTFFTSFDLLMGTYGCLLQIYFDFSGYTDMALGLSTLLGIEIAGNFNQPFKAENVSQFWKRWHISLYSWLNDYVYQPIAFHFRRYRMTGTVLAIFITFLISGIWHGANLTFIIWGLLHGTAIVLEILTGRVRSILGKKMGWAYRFLGVLLTFHFLALSSVLIKSADIQSALSYYQRMFQQLDFSLFGRWFSIYRMPFIVMSMALLLQYLPSRFYTRLNHFFTKLPVVLLALFFALLIVLLFQIASKEAMPFIYIEY